MFINILVFLLVFAVVRIILAFIMGGVDYAWKLPQLRAGDPVIIRMLGADGRSFSCASERCPAYLLRADGTIEPIE